MPKLSGSSLLFTRLTLRRQREVSSEKKKKSRNPERENMQVKKEEGWKGAIRSVQNNSLRCFVSRHHLMWTYDACFRACMHVFKIVVQLNIPLSRHSCVLHQSYYYSTVIKKSGFQIALLRQQGEKRGLYQDRGNAMTVSSCIDFSSSMSIRKAYSIDRQ